MVKIECKSADSKTERTSNVLANLAVSTHLAVNERGKWQVVKEIGEVLPDVRVAVLAQTLIIEAVDLRDLTTLVVATQNCDAVFKTNLKTTKHLQVTGNSQNANII